MTKRQPEADQTATQAESTPRRTRPARRSAGKKHYIQFLPEGADSEPEFKIELPAHVDPERFIDKQEDFEAGRYRIALRDDGKFTRESWTYRKNDELSEGFTTVQPDEDDLEDTEDFEPAASNGATLFTPQDIMKLVATTVNTTIDARERAQRAAQGQPDPMDMYRQMRELHKEEREEMRREMQTILEAQGRNTTKVVEDDEETSVAKILVKNPAIAERVMSKLVGASADAPQEAWYTDVIKELGKNPQLISQGVGAIQSVFKGATSATNGNSAHTAGQAQTNAAQVDPINLTLTIIVDDLKKNKRTGHAADAIDDLFMKMPDLKPQLEPFFAAPANELLSQLSAAVGENLLEYSHSIAWIENLQAEFENAEDSDEVEKAGIEENSEAASGKNSG
jgi:hypothetical protein